MKVKNVAFSGFAAAIMVSAGIASASAAPQIASKQYVDNKVSTDVKELQTTIENNYTKTEQLQDVIVTNITNELQSENSELKTAIDQALDTKADTSTVNQISTTVNNLNTTVGQLETDVAGKADKLTGEAIKAGNIATIDATGNYVAGTVAAADLVTNATVTEKITNALEQNESVKEIITTIVSNGDVVTDAIDKSVESGTLKTELDKKANVADVYTKEEANAKIIDLAIPKPTGSCAAESGRCVLSVDSAGNSLMWLDVTAPLESTVTPAG